MPLSLSPEIIILIAIVAAVALIIGALLSWLLVGRGSKDEAPTNVPAKAEPKPVEKPTPPKPPSPEELMRRRCDEPLRLWRDRSTGALLVELDGQTYNSADKLSPAQRQAIPSLMRELGVWLGVVRAPAAPTVPVAPGQDAAKPVPPLRPVVVPGPVAAAPAGEPQVRPVPADISAAFTPVAKIAAERPKTMVEQINDLVQEMLPASPLSGHSLRLMETPNGLLIWYDLQKFDGIDAVTDPQAQSLLRAAVAEWERRSK